MPNAEKIKKRLRKMNMTQKDIAEVWKVALPTVSQKLNRVRPMTLDEAERLAKLLQIRDEEFGDYFFA